ncbi:hypothetical protein RDABS01_030373 [Bienertia sinuspersici]
MKKQEPSKLVEFNNLPKDIIFDIFSRIPLKTLCQFRVVCKKWQFHLCRNPEFRVFYHKKHKINPILIFNQQNTENPSTQLSSYFIDGTRLSQISTNFAQPLVSIFTCNGILCLISKTNVFLYDPITKLLSNLPNSKRFKSTFSWAFGYSKFRNVFKLLHFYTIEKFDNFHYCPINEVICEILSKPISDLWVDSLEEWRNLGNCPYEFLGRKNYAFVDGKFYWLVRENKFNFHCIRVMSFHLETEIFGIVCFSRNFSDRSVECLDLVEIRDRLCMTDRLPGQSSMNIWMMVKEDDGFANLWVKKYEIDLNGIDHHDVRILGHFPRRNNDDDDDEGEILMKIGQSFGFYELENGVYREMTSEVNKQEWGLQLLLNRKSIL